ncbi:MAG: hypothetical protein QXO57_03785 [Candidatus Aenigmatarchaeota archaeon]|nr:hypothetical protein [Candidatus Aenigmarchaeota archaeon]
MFQHPLSEEDIKSVMEAIDREDFERFYSIYEKCPNPLCWLALLTAVPPHQASRIGEYIQNAHVRYKSCGSVDLYNQLLNAVKKGDYEEYEKLRREDKLGVGDVLSKHLLLQGDENWSKATEFASRYRAESLIEELNKRNTTN